MENTSKEHVSKQEMDLAVDKLKVFKGAFKVLQYGGYTLATLGVGAAVFASGGLLVGALGAASAASAVAGGYGKLASLQQERRLYELEDLDCKLTNDFSEYAKQEKNKKPAVFVVAADLWKKRKKRNEEEEKTM